MKIHLIDYFEHTVQLYPDKIAIKHGSEYIRFHELENKAKTIASCIMRITGRSRKVPIAVFLPKEINSVIADVGILYSSNFFMNLDVKMPAERVGNILSVIKPAVIISDSKNYRLLPEHHYKVVLLDEIEWSTTFADQESLGIIREKSIDTDPFCIINTSGSTGTPKGVVLNHRSFLDFLRVSNSLFEFDGSEVIGSLSPIVFDIFDFELCMMMVNGSQIVLLDSMLASFPARLLETVRLNCVNFLFWVPSIMVNIANLHLLERITLPDLKMIWFAGEVFPTKQFLVWYDAFPNTKFVNLYGPIEITLDCTYYIIKERPREDVPLPIGIPYKNTDVIILNERDEECEAGEDGELCVRGTSLAMGYYNNPQKTASVFVQNPLNSSYPELIYRTGDMVQLQEDGNIIFKGRKDNLIKHLGYRIELEEIEHIVVNVLKVVDTCCAVYKQDEKQIVLYYENNKELTVKEWRTAISKVLPNYMIPAVFSKMDAMPRNANGKVDRQLLKELANEKREAT